MNYVCIYIYIYAYIYVYIYIYIYTYVFMSVPSSLYGLCFRYASQSIQAGSQSIVCSARW